MPRACDIMKPEEIEHYIDLLFGPKTNLCDSCLNAETRDTVQYCTCYPEYPEYSSEDFMRTITVETPGDIYCCKNWEESY